jgi:hypothetical protein
MADEDLAPLVEDVRAHGLRERIVLYEGKILDGRNRFRACEAAGVAPAFREFGSDPLDGDDALSFVVSRNVLRRHLSKAQLGMVAGRTREIYDRLAKERKSAGGKEAGRSRPKQDAVNLPHPIPDAGDSRDQAGRAAGVSGKTVDYACKVLEEGTQKLIDAVDSDMIAVSTAARATTLSREEQDAIADRAARRRAEGHKRRRRPVEDHSMPGTARRHTTGPGRPGTGHRCRQGVRRRGPRQRQARPITGEGK